MSEVLLVVASDASEEALQAAMKRRRWEPVEGRRGWFRCPFEHGFLDELETLVHADLRGALGAETFRAAFVHTAEPTRFTTAVAAPSEFVPGPFRDAGATPEAGLLADVLLDVPRDVAETLSSRGWARVEGTAALAHAFDLRMFGAIEARVRVDLAFAAHALGRPDATGMWALSTHRVVPLRSEAPPPARRALPWD